MSRGVEIAKGAVTGDVASVNKLRSLTAEEIQTCECVSIAEDTADDPGRKSVDLVK